MCILQTDFPSSLLGKEILKHPKHTNSQLLTTLTESPLRPRPALLTFTAGCTSQQLKIDLVKKLAQERVGTLTSLALHCSLGKVH